MNRPRNIILFLILIGIITPLLWFKPGYIIAGHDAGLALDPIVHFIDRLSLWTYRYGFGSDQSYAVGGFFIHGLEAFFAMFGFSLALTEKLFFIVWFMLPGLAFYYLGRTISSEKKDQTAWLIGSVFYMFNHFILQGWFVAERTKFSLYIALPIVLALFIQFNQKRIGMFRTAALISIVIFLLNGGGFIPLYGSLLISWILGVIYFFALTPTLKKLASLISLTIITGVFGVVINAYWFIPYAYDSYFAFASTLLNTGGIDGIKNWIHAISMSATYDNLLRLQGIQEWFVNPLHPYAKVFISNILVIGLSFMLPVLAFLGIKLSERKIRREMLFFGFLALISMVFVAGSQMPFGYFYLFLIEYLPGFTIFRTPFYKFAPSLWLAYSVLIGYALNKIALYDYSSLKKYSIPFIKRPINLRNSILFPLIIVLSVSGIILYSFPFLDGRFFDYEVGKRSTRIAVPEYFWDFNRQFAEKSDPLDRTLLLPEHNISLRLDSFNWGYWSLGPIQSLISNRSFVSNNATMIPDELQTFDVLYEKFKSGNDSWRTLASWLGINGVLLRNDFYWNEEGYVTERPERYLESFSKLASNSATLNVGEWHYAKPSVMDNKRFYQADKQVIFDGSTDKIGKLLEMKDITAKTAVLYKRDVESDSQIMSLPNSKYISYSNCIDCKRQTRVLALPDSDDWGPRSRFFPITKYQENKSIRSFGPDERLSFLRATMVKRIRSFLDSYDHATEQDVKMEVLNELESIMTQMSDIVSEQKGYSIGRNDKYIELSDQLKEYKKLSYQYFERAVDHEEFRMLYSLSEQTGALIAKLDSVIFRTSDDQNKKFLFSIYRDGQYTIEIPAEQLGLNQINMSLPVLLDTEEMVIDFISEDGWLKSKNLFTLKEGLHSLTLRTVPTENIFLTKDFYNYTTRTAVDRADILLKTDVSDQESCAGTELPEGDGKTTYRFSFNYQAINGKQQLGVVQTHENLDELISPWAYKRLNTSPDVQQFDDIITPAKGVKLHFLLCQMPKYLESRGTETRITNLTYQRISEPELFFVENNQISYSSNPVDITRISNTDYSVSANSDKKSLLVFAERYSNKWAMNKSDSLVTKLRNTLRAGSSDEVIRPVKVLGMMNGWIIDPEQENVEITYMSQYIFLVSIGISVSALLMILFIIYKKK